MEKNIEVIQTNKSKDCYCKGTLENKCKACQGTKKFLDPYYIFIVGKYAIGGDTLK
jgi:hypothetical protein